ncbi:MAG TPA: phage holin family protein [Acidimicrobiales bacterium]|nr:phage holin family protein [Acidimicrobiales bacterium]
MTDLVHEESELAKAELAQKARQAGLGAGAMGAAAVLGLLGLGCLLAAAIAGLHLVIALWVAALVVGGSCLLVAGMTVLAARRPVRQATPPVPTEAIESTKEDVRWLKTQATSARR